MRKLVLRFLEDDGGATAIEYGLIAAGISVVIIVAVNTIGTNLNGVFTSVSSQAEIVIVPDSAICTSPRSEPWAFFFDGPRRREAASGHASDLHRGSAGRVVGGGRGLAIM